MATILLQVAGTTLGAMVGGPVGAAIGQAIGAAAGSAIDASLIQRAGGGRTVEGPRLKDLDVLASTEGAPIPRVYGRARVGGQVIWATPIEEETRVSRERGRTKGAPRTTRVDYAYHANLAVGLCEGPIAFVRRVWADGRELDLSLVEMRVHRGSEDQAPDPLIVARGGGEGTPAYRGLAYVVFERLPLADFGNRIPQLAFEVVRPVAGLAAMIRAVCLIPGASEFAYAPHEIVRVTGPVGTVPENRHQLFAAADIHASLDALQALCPNLERVSVVASWFGDDLRAGACTIAPRTEAADRATIGGGWSVAGLTRATARVVSPVDGRPAYGGTPADESVVRLIRELKERGLAVTLYPFVMMDVPAGNGMPDPGGLAEQPPFPWRGRITCHPAPGRPGSPDGTAAAGAQVAALFGTCGPGDFAVIGEGVLYGGPPDWSLRRLVLHYAHLAIAAGGVDAFVIGSELVGVTRVRSGPGAYPAAAQLCALAADARAVLGAGTRITYAADWTEYGAHELDGGAELRFPLDPLWAHPAVDAVGIDYYPPISDWRDGTGHLDAAEARGPHDTAYLRRRLASGEGFEWFYATPADRAAQIRTPIADGAHGKPWVFRVKDLVSWWSEPHVERMGGVEIGATAWAPRSKPIWLTEIGVPAVDKGPNGPNVFPDPKSSESARPPHSSGARDDLVQARALEAVLSRFDPALPGHAPGMNPWSADGARRMVDPSHVYVWAWDARPYPAFPDLAGVWSDGANWDTGHWITGRLEGLPLDRLVAAVLAEHGVTASLDLALDGFLDGAVIDRPVSACGALE
ncbi:MAG TPA: glycoside hydrolase TIM-barrel-like domain-containing protein, partial [Salinarimonas sp.]|nr:glycoside hydrolase TIM-barrel-like domain-containing protein [Salinarimonas sp.]